MSTDYAEKEREFIANLGPDTGRDLAGWMDAIKNTNLSHRNDIIDWLRSKGFPFAKASWLERIHHNGGRLIYADDGPRKAPAPRRPRETAPVREVHARAPSDQVADAPIADRKPHILQARAADIVPSAPPQEAGPSVDVSLPLAGRAPAPPSPVVTTDAALDRLLAKAKAYRPLAQLVLNETTAALPAATFTAKPPQIVFHAPHEFAELVIGPKDIRLCLDFGMRPLEEVSRQAGSQVTTGRAKPFPHVIVLTDARQVTAGLVELLREAVARSAR